MDDGTVHDFLTIR